MNPNQILQSLLSNNQVMSNPMVQNASRMYKANDINGLKTLAENVCKSKGTTVDAIRQQLGI